MSKRFIANTSDIIFKTEDKVLLQAYRKETPIIDGENVSIQIETGCKLNAATDVPETKNFLVMSAVFTMRGGAMASGRFPLKLIVSNNSLLDGNYEALEFDVIETSIER